MQVKCNALETELLWDFNRSNKRKLADKSFHKIYILKKSRLSSNTLHLNTVKSTKNAKLIMLGWFHTVADEMDL